jgi:thiol-disulfide isomerase/thioredoxin
MKFIVLYFLYLFSFFLCPAQNNASIISTNINPKAGIENQYYYLPPKGLLLPPKMQVLVAYENRKKFFKQKIPIIKVGNRYSFSFKAPDSTAVLIFSIVNEKKRVLQSNNLALEKEIVVDNNKEEGFIIYLHDKKGRKFIFSAISLAKLMSGFAIYTLQLKSISNSTIIDMYETAYKGYPSLKQDDSYADYLITLYSEKADISRPELLAHAKQLCLLKKDETKLLNAKRIYALLETDTLEKETEKQILIQFPDGLLAKEFFWDSLYKKTDNTEQSVLFAMDDYIRHFKDSSSDLKDKFYTLIITDIFYKSKQFEKLATFEKLIGNKMITIYTYNYQAWKLVGKGLDNGESNLELAKALSSKSIEYIESMIKKGIKLGGNGEDLYAVHDMNINTYALVLYKLGQYDSAFYHQYLIYKKDKELLDDAGYERLAAYMEKAKGIDSTRNFIEDQLARGLNSPRVLNQLQAIYKQLNLSPDAFNQLQIENNGLVKLKNIKLIKAKMGSTVAKDFLLKNILNEEVLLSSYRNKVVVLDFWATWCGPCKGSFPKMQELVNKYKADTGVVFLFIDVWESKEPKKVKEMVTEYIKENNFSFNVLFDENRKVVKDYRIQAIPQKFIIDKRGNIVFMSDDINYLDDISLAIEAAKK